MPAFVSARCSGIQSSSGVAARSYSAVTASGSAATNAQRDREGKTYRCFMTLIIS